MLHTFSKTVDFNINKICFVSSFGKHVRITLTHNPEHTAVRYIYNNWETAKLCIANKGWLVAKHRVVNKLYKYFMNTLKMCECEHRHWKSHKSIWGYMYLITNCLHAGHIQWNNVYNCICVKVCLHKYQRIRI